MRNPPKASLIGIYTQLFLPQVKDTKRSGPSRSLKSRGLCPPSEGGNSLGLYCHVLPMSLEMLIGILPLILSPRPNARRLPSLSCATAACIPAMVPNVSRHVRPLSSLRIHRRSPVADCHRVRWKQYLSVLRSEYRLDRHLAYIVFGHYHFCLAPRPAVIARLS